MIIIYESSFSIIHLKKQNQDKVKYYFKENEMYY